MKLRYLGMLLAGALTAALSGCVGTEYLTNDPTILLNYQKDPNPDNLAILSSTYLSTINQNRKNGKVQPGLYCDYAVTLYLLGKPEAAESWFNKEVATFPYTAEYVKQLRQDLDERFNGADPNRNRRYTIDDVNNMDEIGVLRPSENREASKLTKESYSEAERVSRDAVRGLDKPLTKAEKKALKKVSRENRRQAKAAKEDKFSAPNTEPGPGLNAEDAAKAKARIAKQEARKQKHKEAAEARAAKRAAKKAAKIEREERKAEEGAEKARLDKEANTNDVIDSPEKAAKKKAAADKIKLEEQRQDKAEKKRKTLSRKAKYDKKDKESTVRSRKNAAKDQKTEEKAAAKAVKKAKRKRAADDLKQVREQQKVDRNEEFRLKKAKKTDKRSKKSKEQEMDDKAFQETFGN